MARKRTRLPNIGNWLVSIGIALVAVSFWVPYATAGRTARVETRAEHITRFLLESALAAAPIDFDNPADALLVSSELKARCVEAGFPESAIVEALPDRDRPSDAAPGLWFRGKHYHYYLTRAPQLDPSAPPDRLTPFEAYGWPSKPRGPGHTAFCVPEAGDVAQPVFTRNLHRGYVGTRSVPFPGAAEPRAREYSKNTVNHERWYRGRDDERWLMRPRFVGATIR